MIQKYYNIASLSIYIYTQVIGVFIAIIIGSVVGFVAAIVIPVAIIAFCCYRFHSKRRTEQHNRPVHAPTGPAQMPVPLYPILPPGYTYTMAATGADPGYSEGGGQLTQQLPPVLPDTKPPPVSMATDVLY